MDLDEFVKNFADVFDDTDASEITADTVFQDLEEWGSLINMSIIAMAKTKYGKTISAKEIRSCETVAELKALVESK
jgi:acyl carrier protein